jgi:hypothetical protein
LTKVSLVSNRNDLQKWESLKVVLKVVSEVDFHPQRVLFSASFTIRSHVNANFLSPSLSFSILSSFSQSPYFYVHMYIHRYFSALVFQKPSDGLNYIPTFVINPHFGINM